jgi:butyryl-CoA dehydrogenase
MYVEFSEEHRMLRAAAKDFAEKEIAPLVNDAEENEKFPVQLFSQLGELGYLCASHPAQYGGAEVGMVGECIILEEISKVAAGIASALTAQGGIATIPILEHGTEEQKQKYLIPAIKGNKIGAFGLTEPNAGSDAAAVETIARREGDEYILNGTKMYITNGTICDYVLVVASTDRSQRSRGISAFIVEKGTPGFTAIKMHKFCMRSAELAELVFEDCRIPTENLIGEEGKGFGYVMECLDAGRVSHSATSIGLAQAAYEACLEYVQQREQFGQPIHRFQATGFKVARMAMEIEAARWLMYRAAWLYDEGTRRFKEASMSKLFASEVVQKVTSDAMQIHGAVAIMAESPIQRYFRDARRNTITEGTSEVQQLVISRAIGLR